MFEHAHAVHMAVRHSNFRSRMETPTDVCFSGNVVFVNILLYFGLYIKLEITVKCLCCAGTVFSVPNMWNLDLFLCCCGMMELLSCIYGNGMRFLPSLSQ